MSRPKPASLNAKPTIEPGACSISLRPWAAIPAVAPMLRPRDVVKATGMTKSVIYDRISRGLFPPFIKLGERTSAMPAAWLDAYIQAQARIALAGITRAESN